MISSGSKKKFPAGNACWCALFGTHVYCHNSTSHMTAKGAAMIIRTDSSKYDQVSIFGVTLYYTL